MAERIVCPGCRGLGRVLSDDFWTLRDYLKAADAAEQAEATAGDPENSKSR